MPDNALAAFDPAGFSVCFVKLNRLTFADRSNFEFDYSRNRTALSVERDADATARGGEATDRTVAKEFTIVGTFDVVKLKLCNFRLMSFLWHAQALSMRVGIARMASDWTR